MLTTKLQTQDVTCMQKIFTFSRVITQFQISKLFGKACIFVLQHQTMVFENVELYC
ncbi:hypothetical protein FQR65_LT06277 [Abscondita terminalis]|nr:hypothetical protein FQR65_LT06277 [Abscondita terminalis]